MKDTMHRNVRIFLIVSMILLALSQGFMGWVLDLCWAYATAGMAAVAAVVQLKRLRESDARTDA